jgi:hypothetical protein
MRKKTPSKKKPSLRVIVVQIAGDEPLIFDFQTKRRPSVERVHRAMEAFKEKLLRTSTPS